MKNFILKNRQLITGILVGSITIFFVTSLIVDKRLAGLQNNIELSLNISDKELLSLAGAIARGETNSIAAGTISDCTVIEQAQFDNRLGKLDSGLSLVELRELDTLFSRCAPVAVIRRSAMVVQLTAEFEKYNLLIEQRKLVGEFDEFIQRQTAWGKIVINERKITDLSFNLVTLQYEIISQLITGLKVDSDPANELKNKGQVIRTELSKLLDETAKLREELK